MAAGTDPFSDMLGPGEHVVASLGGPGPSVERATGTERTWLQLALTQTRLLVVRLVQGPLGGAWQPTSRLAVGREFVRIARFPRTPTSPARLEIYGCGQPVTLSDIDSERVFPHVGPFLSAWGGPVEGAGTVAPRAQDPYDALPAADQGRLLWVIVGIFTLLWLTCACSGIAALVGRLI